MPFRLPPMPRTARPLEADVLVRLREPGGRTIERKVTLPVSTRRAAHRRQAAVRRWHRRRRRDGRRSTSCCSVPDGKRSDCGAFKWELVAPRPALAVVCSATASGATRPSRPTRRIAAGHGQRRWPASPPASRCKADWGRYRLDVTTGSPVVPTTSVAFNAGWHAERERRQPGDARYRARQADLQGRRHGAAARSPRKEAGKAQIAVLGSGLLRHAAGRRCRRAAPRSRSR